MSRDIEALISKCVEGRASRDVLREIEEELIDVHRVRNELLRDLKNSGLPIESSNLHCEGYRIEVRTSSRLLERVRSDLMTVLDTYSRTYPEVEFYVNQDFRRRT